MNLVLFGFVGSFVAGLMTSVGAIPVLFGHSITVRNQDMLLGFAAGVMLAASFFSLIIPGLEYSTQLYGEGIFPPLIVVSGLIIGVITIGVINDKAPHEHFIMGVEGPPTKSLLKIWLFVIAITIHNFPEGLAVGVGFGSGDLSNAISLTIGIGLQNAPEGLAVAIALASEGYSRIYSFFIASLTGLVEPVGGLIGALIVTYSEHMLPWGLAFAAGAMLYVISHEIIPETHSRGHHNQATAGLTVGLVIMMFLDVYLG